MIPDAAIAAAVDWLLSHPKFSVPALIVVTLAALSLETPA